MLLIAWCHWGQQWKVWRVCIRGGSQTVNHNYIYHLSCFLLFRISMVWLERLSNENILGYRFFWTYYKNVTPLYAHPFTHNTPNALFYVYIIVLMQKKNWFVIRITETFNLCTNCSQNTHTDRSFTSSSIWSLIF